MIDHHFGLSTVLWLTGPIEEGAKLLVPSLFLVFGAARFKDPLVGLYLVLVSGATTGAVEGAEWESRTNHVWLHLQLALVRPAAELPHVFVTGFAGAVIWLAAWRRGRSMTLAGAGAFAIAAGLHSLHDGFITLFGVSPQPAPSSIAQSAGDAIGKGLAGGFFALGIGIAAFLLGRHGARELSSPASVAGAPPPWRPQIKTWGAINPVRVQAPVPQVAWSPAGYGGYGGYGSNGCYAVLQAPGPPAAGPYAGYPSHAPPVANGGYAPPAEGNGAYPPPIPAPPVAPAYVPDLAVVPSPPPMVSTVPSPMAPPAAPPGWYPYGADPGRSAWWSGVAWSAPVRWDGLASGVSVVPPTWRRYRPGW